MALTFFCSHCGKRKFFSQHKLFQNEKVCPSCFDSIIARHKEEEFHKSEVLRRQQQRKQQRRKVLNDRRANEELKQQLAQDREVEKSKEQKALDRKERIEQMIEESPEFQDPVEPSRIIRVSKQLDAKKLSEKFDKVLYVFVDVKHIKAVEWIKGKKRIALNKTREVRRTHKGGFSQEKFQRFVDHQRRETPKWVEEHLLSRGVLRGPYDKLVIEADPQMEEFIRDTIEQAWFKA